MRSGVTLGVGVLTAALLTSGATAVSSGSATTSSGSSAVSPAAVRAEDGFEKRLGYLNRHQPFEGKFVVATLAKASPSDPNRCAAYGFAQWARIPHTVAYQAVVQPPPSISYVGQRTKIVYDDAPFVRDYSMGEVVRRNPAPPTSFVTTLGTITWPATIVQANINWYSTWQGCASAESGLLRWTVVRGTANLSIPIERLVRRKPPKRSAISDAPKDAVMMVTEVNGKLYRRDAKGRKHRLRYREWVKPGDVLVTEPGTTASLEMITGGRIGVVGDRAILVLSESQVKDITDEGKVKKGVRKAVRVWRKMSKQPDLLEIEAAGGVMGIKG